jgi:hypothetical protein
MEGEHVEIVEALRSNEVRSRVDPRSGNRVLMQTESFWRDHEIRRKTSGMSLTECCDANDFARPGQADGACSRVCADADSFAGTEHCSQGCAQRDELAMGELSDWLKGTDTTRRRILEAVKARLLG